MALDRQVHVYSVDTRAFYTEEEQVLDREITRLKALRRLLKDAHAASTSARAPTISPGRRRRPLRSGPGPSPPRSPPGRRRCARF